MSALHCTFASNKFKFRTHVRLDLQIKFIDLPKVNNNTHICSLQIANVDYGMSHDGTCFRAPRSSIEFCFIIDKCSQLLHMLLPKTRTISLTDCVHCRTDTSLSAFRHDPVGPADTNLGAMPFLLAGTKRIAQNLDICNWMALDPTYVFRHAVQFTYRIGPIPLGVTQQFHNIGPASVFNSETVAILIPFGEKFV